MKSKLFPLKLRSMKEWFYLNRNFYILFFSLLYSISYLALTGSAVSAEIGSQIQKIAIIPFQINSQKDISYIKNGVFQMLSSRLAWKDNTFVASEKEIDESIIKVGNIEKPTKKEPVNNTIDYFTKIAENTKSNYIIRGSITEFAGAFSVDATVYNVSQNQLQSFFTQAESPEKIIPSVEILSAKINKDIFNRDTAALALIDEDKNRAAQNSIRANPERLMPLASLEQNTQKKERPFWKFWGKDKNEDELVVTNPNTSTSTSNSPTESEDQVVINTAIDPEDEDLEEDKKPFWKFW